MVSALTRYGVPVSLRGIYIVLHEAPSGSDLQVECICEDIFESWNELALVLDLKDEAEMNPGLYLVGSYN